MALNFTYKEKKGSKAKIYFWFMKKCVNPVYMDYLHVPSNEYANYVSKTFDFPRNRILVTPFGVDDCYYEWKKIPFSYKYENGYALSIGRSNRDFDFLIQSWENINYPLVIISDSVLGLVTSIFFSQAIAFNKTVSPEQTFSSSIGIIIKEQLVIHG